MAIAYYFESYLSALYASFYLLHYICWHRSGIRPVELRQEHQGRWMRATLPLTV